VSDRRTPDFVVAGMPRAGTTFLYHNLQRHPRIHLPWRKELNYLNLHRDRGPDWYAEQLAGAGPGQVIGDVEPGYFLDPDVPALLQRTAPGVKVILGVREPVSWAVSAHRHFARLGDRVPPFETFVRRGWVRQQDGGEMLYRFAGDAVPGLIRGWRRAFGGDLLLFDYDHFSRDRLAVLRAIERFLALDPFFAPGNFDDRRVNASNERPLPGYGRLVRGRLGAAVGQRRLARWAFRKLRPWIDRWQAARAIPAPAPGPGPADLPAQTLASLAGAVAAHEALFAGGPICRSTCLVDTTSPVSSGARA
jgi:hypothetical protein